MGQLGHLLQRRRTRDLVVAQAGLGERVAIDPFGTRQDAQVAIVLGPAAPAGVRPLQLQHDRGAEVLKVAQLLVLDLAALAAHEQPRGPGPGAVLSRREVVDAEPAVELELGDHLCGGQHPMLLGRSTPVRPRDQRCREPVGGDARRLEADPEQQPQQGDAVIVVRDRYLGVAE
jgi:hypothetical protein